MDKKYLYGASVQGIQSLIFETNKLKEIIGASQLVDSINKEVFEGFYKSKIGKDVNKNNIILNAAGNIRYIFDSREDCEKFVREFPKFISNYAPGITISQAVVEIGENLKHAYETLERILKTQRNRVQMPVDIAFIGVARSRRTGKPGVEYKNSEVLDRATRIKREKAKQKGIELFKKFSPSIKKGQITTDISELTGKSDGSWIAIIHADGNGLGNILQNLTKGLGNEQDVKEVYTTFSKVLEEATIAAAQTAFKDIVEQKIEQNEIFPFRPVVLGGDDLTVIIRADLAFEFTIKFLEEFERETEEKFKQLRKFNPKIIKLTASAGIAYIKDNYPFHYAVYLAEALTDKAKKFSKLEVGKDDYGVVPSSLAFYKVQASFTESLEDMVRHTHYRGNKNLFYAGPYLLKKSSNGQFRTVEELTNLLNILKMNYTKDESKGISKLRQWITEIMHNEAKAEFLMKRIKQVNYDLYNDLNLDKEMQTIQNDRASILADLIDLHTFNLIYKK